MHTITSSLERNDIDGGYYLVRYFYVTVRSTTFITDYVGTIVICSLSD